jgi:hypothetical protein
MKRLTFALGLAMLGSSPVLSQTDDDRTLSFGCNDLVVIGRLKNGEYHAVSDPDDILGHGWVDATLLVRRVVKGVRTRPKMPVRYFAHTYMRDDRDFMLVLSPQPDGALVVRRGHLMSAHPKLAARCN